MNYFGVLKRAYEITIKNRFLWIFGLFIGGAAGLQGFTSGSNYSPSDAELNQVTPRLGEWFAQYWPIVLVVGLVLTLICLAVAAMGVISDGALILSVKKLDEDKKTNFSEGFRAGLGQFWRVLGLNLVYGLIFLLIISVLALPIVLLGLMGAWPVAIALGLIFLIVFLLVIVVTALIAPYSYRILLLEKQSIFTSVRSALHFVRKNLPEVVIFYLLMMAVGLAYGMAIFFATILIGGILFSVGLGLWLITIPVGLIYGLIAGIAFIITIIIISAAFKTFGSTALTLAYLEIKSKK